MTVQHFLPFWGDTKINHFLLSMNVHQTFTAICKGFAMSVTTSSLFAMDSQCPSCIHWKYQFIAICAGFAMSVTNSLLFAMDSQCPSCINWKYRRNFLGGKPNIPPRSLFATNSIRIYCKCGGFHEGSPSLPSTLLPMIWERRVGMLRAS